MQTLTGIPEHDLKVALKWLCNPKFKVLDRESPASPDFTATEKLRLAIDFANQLLRVVLVPKGIPIVQQEVKIDRERQEFLEALIVRIMKAKKTLHLNALMEEIMSQVTLFQVQPNLIKERIESLIEREYLKRDDTDRNLFVYLP